MWGGIDRIYGMYRIVELKFAQVNKVIAKSFEKIDDRE